MSDASSSSPARMLAVLDPFTVDHSEWMAEDLSEAQHDTTSSTNHTIRELCRTGLLARLPGGSYIVGGKVSDPDTVNRRVALIAKAVPPVLHGLSVQTGCASLLSSVYWIAAPRAKPCRRFCAHARKLYDSLPPGTAQRERRLTLQSQLKHIRHAGYYINGGELDEHADGFGVPVIPETEAIGSSSLVYALQRAAFLVPHVIGEPRGREHGDWRPASSRTGLKMRGGRLQE